MTKFSIVYNRFTLYCLEQVYSLHLITIGTNGNEVVLCCSNAHYYAAKDVERYS